MPTGPLLAFEEPREKVRVEFASLGAERPGPEELKSSFSSKVRSDSEARATLTSIEALVELSPHESAERVRAILTEMGAEDRFRDIKAVITDSGKAYLYCERHITMAEAVERAFREECEEVVAARVRDDSQNRANLTPISALRGLLPRTEQDRIDAIASRMGADPRYFDVKGVTGPGGEVFLHSDLYLTGEDALLLARGGAGDPRATIAEVVREASRLHPRPVRCRPLWARILGVADEELPHRIGELLRDPEYVDIARLVHPATGSVYLYSTRYLDEGRAYAIMDWEEVGRAANP